MNSYIGSVKMQMVQVNKNGGSILQKVPNYLFSIKDYTTLGGVNIMWVLFFFSISFEMGSICPLRIIKENNMNSKDI